MSRQYVPSRLEIALRGWIRIVHPLVEAVYANQSNAPRPAEPYITLKHLNDRGHGSPVLELSDTASGTGTTYVGSITEHYTGIVSINIYADNHAELMRMLKRSIRNPAVQVYTAGQKIGITKALPSSLQPELRETSWDDRSQCDFMFVFAEQDEIEAEGLESIVGTVEVGALEAGFEAP